MNTVFFLVIDPVCSRCPELGLVIFSLFLKFILEGIDYLFSLKEGGFFRFLITFRVAASVGRADLFD